MDPFKEPFKALKGPIFSNNPPYGAGSWASALSYPTFAWATTAAFGLAATAAGAAGLGAGVCVTGAGTGVGWEGAPLGFGVAAALGPLGAGIEPGRLSVAVGGGESPRFRMGGSAAGTKETETALPSKSSVRGDTKMQHENECARIKGETTHSLC